MDSSQRYYSVLNSINLSELIKTARVNGYLWGGPTLVEKIKVLTFDTKDKVMFWESDVDTIINEVEMLRIIAELNPSTNTFYVKVTPTTSRILQELAFNNNYTWVMNGGKEVRYTQAEILLFQENKIYWCSSDLNIGKYKFATLEQAINFIENNTPKQIEIINDFIINYKTKRIYRSDGDLSDSITFEEAIKIYVDLIRDDTIFTKDIYGFIIKAHGKIDSLTIGCVKKIPVDTLIKIYNKIKET